MISKGMKNSGYNITKALDNRLHFTCAALKIYLLLTPDIVEAGFIMVYILSPDDVLESCGLGMIGVLAPGGGPPGGPP